MNEKENIAIYFYFLLQHYNNKLLKQLYVFLNNLHNIILLKGL